MQKIIKRRHNVKSGTGSTCDAVSLIRSEMRGYSAEGVQLWSYLIGYKTAHKRVMGPAGVAEFRDNAKYILVYEHEYSVVTAYELIDQGKERPIIKRHRKTYPFFLVNLVNGNCFNACSMCEVEAKLSNSAIKNPDIKWLNTKEYSVLYKAKTKGDFVYAGK